MKWIENAYCHDNGDFTSGIYGQSTGGRYPAYYGGNELGKFSKIADAEFAIEKAYSERMGKPMPVRIRLGPLASRM